MISYAQNGEDVVLDRAFPPGHRGFYIDVGASDPVVDSVTKHFYDRGWRGINIEPARVTFRALREARPRDINLPVALGAAPGEVTFYELPPAMNGCSTISATVAEDLQGEGWEVTERPVEVATLVSVCERHAANETIDFLKIDAEGSEADVLAGADFGRFRPRVLVIEATLPNTPIREFERWEPLVLGANYRFVLFDGLNRFYVREEDPELADLLDAPANVFDDFVTSKWEAGRAELERALDQGQAARDALQATRKELARSQGELRDARTELNTTRTALLELLESSRVLPSS